MFFIFSRSTRLLLESVYSPLGENISYFAEQIDRNVSAIICCTIQTRPFECAFIHCHITHFPYLCVTSHTSLLITTLTHRSAVSSFPLSPHTGNTHSLHSNNVNTSVTLVTTTSGSDGVLMKPRTDPQPTALKRTKICVQYRTLQERK